MMHYIFTWQRSQAYNKYDEIGEYTMHLNEFDMSSTLEVSRKFVPIGTTAYQAGLDAAGSMFRTFGTYVYSSGKILLGDDSLGSLKLRLDGNRLVIDNIEITKQNKGVGTSVMKALITKAHSLGLTPVLFTDAMRGKAAQTRLRGFYTSLGFKLNAGENKIKGLKQEFYCPAY